MNILCVPGPTPWCRLASVSTVLPYRLVLPLARRGPLTVSVTPCVSRLACRLSIRPHYAHTLPDTPIPAPQEDYNTRDSSSSHTGYGLDSRDELVHFNDSKRRLRSLDSISNGSDRVQNRSLVLSSCNLTYKFSKPVDRTTSDVTVSEVENHPGQLKRKASIIAIRRTNQTGNIKDTSPEVGREEKTGKDGESEAMDENNREEKQEMLLEQYEGQEPYQYRQQTAQPGLYVLQVRGRTVSRVF